MPFKVSSKVFYAYTKTKLTLYTLHTYTVLILCFMLKLIVLCCFIVNRKTKVSGRCSTSVPVELVSKESQVSGCFGERESGLNSLYRHF